MKELLKRHLPEAVVDFYHKSLAFSSALLRRFPSRHLVVIGVTGTKGKTTTVHLIARILEDAGYKVGAVSSLYFKIGKKEETNKTKMTMPGRFLLQKLLRRMANIDCRYAVLEVTSEGIRQHRHRWIDFDTVAFTNISPEHIESHGSFEKYLSTKQEVFKNLPGSSRAKKIRSKKIVTRHTIIANGDDEHAEKFLSFPADKKFCFHVGAHNADEELAVCEDVTARIERVSAEGAVFMLRGQRFSQKLPGRFNVENALAALTVGISEGVGLAQMAATLSRAAAIPGRMEYIDEGQGFSVVVDYAHTPASLAEVYKTLRESLTERGAKKLIAVLGAAGGGRDRWKRPVFGALAGLWADEIIITNEDPYEEEPTRIMYDVGEGVGKAKNIYRAYAGPEALEALQERTVPMPQYILDRREAIEKACMIAKEGDTVVITGKGAEPAMAVAKGKKIPWDDRQVVREVLAKTKAR